MSLVSADAILLKSCISKSDYGGSGRDPMRHNGAVSTKGREDDKEGMARAESAQEVDEEKPLDARRCGETLRGFLLHCMAMGAGFDPRHEEKRMVFR